MRIVKYEPRWEKKFLSILEYADAEFFTEERLLDEQKNRPSKKLAESFSAPNTKNNCMLLIDGQNIIGFICYRFKDKVGESYKTYVRPKYRRQGWGNLLCEVALGEMRNHGCKTAQCEVDCGNSSMLSLKFRQGYGVLKVQDEFLGHQWIKLSKKLAG